MGIKDRFRASATEVPVSEGVTSGAEVVSEEAKLRAFRKQHQWDPFLDIDKLDSNTPDESITEKAFPVDESGIEEDSPYSEVRSAVPNSDADLPVNTIRAWTLGFIFCTIVAACNILLGLRNAPIIISSTVVQLISYPVGNFWALVVPAWTFSLFGKTFELNPGPFNVKEHTIVTIMTAAGTAPSYAIDILLAQEIYYDQAFHWGFQLLLILSTQAMGLGVAGISRRFLVWPSAMVWPATLVFTSVMYSLHDHSLSDPAATNGWKMGRYIFFLIVAGCTFVWSWIPNVFAGFLSAFTFPIWISPNNVVVNQLFGSTTGFGILPISFDWNTISGYMTSPLQFPAFAIMNLFAGFMFIFIVTLGMTYGGPDYFKYLPISANRNYDHFGKKYNVSRILTPDFTLNETAYKEYSPIIIGPVFSLSYAMSFAALIGTITHVVLFYGPDIWRRVRDSRSEQPDVHLKLMRKYREAPEWWFSLVFLISFAFGMAACQHWPTHLPWWAYIVAILIGVVFFIPVGMVQAITNQQTGLNVITELVVGFMLPGRPVAMMLFKSFGYMMSFNGLNYISDMKVGHYMKIPPRSMFAAQIFAVTWLSIVQIATYNFLRSHINGICTPGQAQGITCPGALTFFNASVIWGVVGPARVFGKGQLFAWTNWFWLIGFALPVIQYLLARRYPKSLLRYIMFPVIFSASGQLPPGTLYYMFVWTSVGLFFNYWIRKRYTGWWGRYIYTLSGALDIGLALCIVCVALGLGLGNANFPDWWGNTVNANTLDFQGLAHQKTWVKGMKPFGPESW